MENKKYRAILADPPWEMGKLGKGKDLRPGRVYKIGASVPVPYPTMTIDEICSLDIQSFAEENCHCWIWATNKVLHDAFHVMEHWGFKYHNVITWVKPAGVGAYLINRTQHLLFGYRGKLYVRDDGRYSPTVFNFTPKKHSEKPESSYRLIESFSFPNYLELFARKTRPNWDVWGNEVVCDVEIK